MKRQFSRFTTISIVVANMVGTGVFTSLGFQVMGITSGFTLLMLWLLGGLISICGAFAYSELGNLFPRSGGEYNFLSKIYHPALGFLAGWISITVGFAAPIAAAAIAFGKYFSSSVRIESMLPSPIDHLSPSVILAIILIIGLSLLHSFNKQAGAMFQNVMTIIKIVFILTLILFGLFYGGHSGLSFAPDLKAVKEMISPSFAISMFFVTYSYSGWNAAAYITSEIKNPKKNIPLSLIVGTAFVTFLYISLSFVFLYSVPIPELSGQIEIGYIFAQKIMGVNAGTVMGLVISFLLISSVSSMIIIGPRVYNAVGEDYKSFRWLSKKYNDTPSIAIIFQSIIAIVFIITSTFENVIILIGFTLNLFTFLTVLGVFVERRKHPLAERTYKTFGHPYTSAFFLLVNLWLLVYGFIYKPVQSLEGIGICLLGLVFYYINKRLHA